jgi:hypothetical protein
VSKIIKHFLHIFLNVQWTLRIQVYNDETTVSIRLRRRDVEKQNGSRGTSY